MSTSFHLPRFCAAKCGVPEIATRRGPVGTDLSSSDVLLKTVYREGIDGDLPPMSKDLGKDLRKLARRVIANTNSGSIIADETAHHRSHVSYLRDTLPKDINNIRVDYYRRAQGFRRDEDSSCSEDSELSGAESSDSDCSEVGFFQGRQIPVGFQQTRRAEKEQIARKQRDNANLGTRQAPEEGIKDPEGKCPPEGIVRMKSRTLLLRPG